eukprot:768759-Hanusia_phi.AAC.11
MPRRLLEYPTCTDEGGGEGKGEEEGKGESQELEEAGVVEGSHQHNVQLNFTTVQPDSHVPSPRVVRCC